MNKPETLIVVGGCFLAGLVIMIGVLFYGALSPNEHQGQTDSNLAGAASATVMPAVSADVPARLHTPEFTSARSDSSLRPAGSYSSW